MTEQAASLILSIGMNAERTEFVVKMEVRNETTDEQMHEAFEGPFNTEAEAKAVADFLAKGFAECGKIKQGTLQDEFLAIANSDKPPAEQIVAMRDVITKRMLSDALYVRIGAEPRFSDEGGRLLLSDEFRSWTQRPGIDKAVDEAMFKDFGIKLKEKE